MEEDSSNIEKRTAYKFLKRLLSYVDSAQEFIAHLGELIYKRSIKHETQECECQRDM